MAGERVIIQGPSQTRALEQGQTRSQGKKKEKDPRGARAQRAAIFEEPPVEDEDGGEAGEPQEDVDRDAQMEDLMSPSGYHQVDEDEVQWCEDENDVDEECFFQDGEDQSRPCIRNRAFVIRVLKEKENHWICEVPLAYFGEHQGRTVSYDDQKTLAREEKKDVLDQIAAWLEANSQQFLASKRIQDLGHLAKIEFKDGDGKRICPVTQNGFAQVLGLGEGDVSRLKDNLYLQWEGRDGMKFKDLFGEMSRLAWAEQAIVVRLGKEDDDCVPDDIWDKIATYKKPTEKTENRTGKSELEKDIVRICALSDCSCQKVANYHKQNERR